MDYYKRLQTIAEDMAKKSTGELFLPDVVPHYYTMAEVALKYMAGVVDEIFTEDTEVHKNNLKDKLGLNK